MDMGIN